MEVNSTYSISFCFLCVLREYLEATRKKRGTNQIVIYTRAMRGLWVPGELLCENRWQQDSKRGTYLGT